MDENKSSKIFVVVWLRVRPDLRGRWVRQRSTTSTKTFDLRTSSTIFVGSDQIWQTRTRVWSTRKRGRRLRWRSHWHSWNERFSWRHAWQWCSTTVWRVQFENAQGHQLCNVRRACRSIKWHKHCQHRTEVARHRQMDHGNDQRVWIPTGGKYLRSLELSWTGRNCTSSRHQSQAEVPPGWTVCTAQRASCPQKNILAQWVKLHQAVRACWMHLESQGSVGHCRCSGIGRRPRGCRRGVFVRWRACMK